MSETRRNKRQNKRLKNKLSKLTFHKLDWLEWISLILAVWFFIYPKPYEVLFTCLLIMPVIGLFLNGITGRPSIASLIQISKDNKCDDKYDVADFIDAPAWILTLRVLIDFEFESFYSMIIPGVIAAILILVFLYFTQSIIINTTKDKTWIVLSLVTNIVIYSFAGTYGANCVYDKSTPKVYAAKVIDKRISKGRRHKTYYIKVEEWGHHYDPENISVTQSQYNEININQYVNIDYKKGLLGIPWYYIE
jgi:hypothetical protein